MNATRRARDRALAATLAALYRARGFQPLPSRLDEKQPLVKYAHLWEQPSPEDLFRRHPTTNIQVMTGRFWRLLVIDLDGPEARDVWKSWGPTPRTWITHSGGNGRHVWFRLPAKFPRPLPKAFLWRGTGKHEAIERLCDRSLVMAPPSIHPRTGRRYRFLAGCSPREVPGPAPCPAWVLERRPVDLENRPVKRGAAGRALKLPISDPVDRARSWGLKLAGPPRASGWVPCYAIGREDQEPSAAIRIDNGYYVDHGTGIKMPFPQLAVAMNAYPTVEDAYRDLSNGH